MGFLDRFKKSADIDKAKELIADNADKVDDGIDKAAEIVDEKTGRKHTDKIDKAAGAAKGAVDKVERQAKAKPGSKAKRR